MLRPSKVAVPRPISSSTTRLRRRRAVQDVRGLLHLHHERRLAARDVVRGADAGEDAVDDAQLGLARRHERAGLRQQAQQRHLAQVGGLAAHVRAGQDRRAGAASPSSVDVVRHERAAGQALDDRMARVDGDQSRRRRARAAWCSCRRSPSRRAPASTSSAASARAVSSTRGASAGDRRRAAPRTAPARARGCARPRRAPSLRTPSAPA